MIAFPDLVTRIGVAGCAIIGPIYLAIGCAHMWAGRDNPERVRELQRIEACMQRLLRRRRP